MLCLWFNNLKNIKDDFMKGIELFNNLFLNKGIVFINEERK